MIKKILFGTVALALVIATVPLFAAFEAHVINVTAHIENALGVSAHSLAFGTVFPQEYTTQEFTVSLSSSFMGAGRVDDVSYKVEQKPKCWNNNPSAPLYGLATKVNNAWACVDNGYVIMPDLCKFLSKTTTDANDTSRPSYFVPAGANPAHCAEPTAEAAGKLQKSAQDISDVWTVDLKVPPIAGTVGADWPASCATYTVPTDGADYGCDLWVEVTGISTPEGTQLPEIQP